MKISKLKVLKSNAGYYIGRTYTEPEMGDVELPYSRESGYFKERELAETYLVEVKQYDLKDGE